MATKMANIDKYGHFEYIVEYPIWVSIKKTSTGKLVLDGQNLIYCLRLKENVKKHSKTVRFRNKAIFGGFWTFLLNGGSKSNSDKLALTYPSNTS